LARFHIGLRALLVQSFQLVSERCCVLGFAMYHRSFDWHYVDSFGPKKVQDVGLEPVVTNAYVLKQ